MRKLLLALVIVLTAALGVSALAVATPCKAAKRRAIHGIVESVGASSITVKLKKGASVTVEVTAKTRIKVNRKAASLADVKAGYRAIVIRAKNGTARAIRATDRVPPRARGVVVRGQVESVGSNSITLKRRNGSTTTVQVTAATRIRVNRALGTLADVQVGYRAFVVRLPDGTAFLLRAHAPKA